MSEADKLVPGFHHPGILVPDLERGMAFHSQLLGYEAIRQKAGIGNHWRAAA